MMNLEKMKQRKKPKGRLKKGLLAATTIFLSDLSDNADAECICCGERITRNLH